MLDAMYAMFFKKISTFLEMTALNFGSFFTFMILWKT